MERLLTIRKMRGCALLTFETGGSLRVPLPLLRERPLRAGQTLDRTEYEAFIAKRAFAFAMDRAGTLLSLRDRSEREIRGALVQCGYPQETVERVLEKLAAYDLVNDERFAAHWTASRARREGRIRVKNELRKKGVDCDTAQHAVESIDEDEQLAQARDMALRFIARDHGAAATQKRRTAQMLARRGYEQDIIRQVVSSVPQSPEED